MFDKWLKLPAHYYLHITALSLLIVGIALSNVLMSIGTIWIIANWIIELDFKSKWQRFKQNKTIIAILILFGLMILSLFWSQDKAYGLKDLLIKLPLITIPLVMGTRPKLEKKVYIFLLYLFIASLLFTTVFNFIRYHTNNLGDKRALSFFISHIRLGGLLCISIFLVGYEIIKKNISVFFIPILLWFLYYLAFSQTISAYLLFAILITLTVLFVIKSKRLKLVLITVGILIVIGVNVKVDTLVNENIKVNQPKEDLLLVKTINNHLYYHNKDSKARENGVLIWSNLSLIESRKEWNSRAKLKFDSVDYNGNKLMGTLFRYMSSRSLLKDSIGIWSLSDDEILKIENGQANYLENNNFKGKINKIIKQIAVYKNNENPNGHSFVQRLAHFKTATHIVKNNWLFGVGIGDVDLSFIKQYEIDNSLLEKDFRLRSHNQFLTLWISLGLVGLLLIIYILVRPLLNNKVEFSTLIILSSLIFSFFTQDMIETQAGVTIFALFYSLGNFTEET